MAHSLMEKASSIQRFLIRNPSIMKEIFLENPMDLEKPFLTKASMNIKEK